MNADDVTRILMELIGRLPPGVRPFVGHVAAQAAQRMDLWVPSVTALLVAVVLLSAYMVRAGTTSQT